MSGIIEPMAPIKTSTHKKCQKELNVNSKNSIML